MTELLISGNMFAPTSWSLIELIFWGALLFGALWVAMYAVIIVYAILLLIWNNIILDLIEFGKKIFRPTK